MNLPSILFLKHTRVWRGYFGGRLLDELERKPQPRDDHFPEDWIASTTRAINPGREHLEREGLTAADVSGEERLLADLCARFPNEMLGEAHVRAFGPTLQFLLKLLDSAVRLPMQCHPTIEFAKARLNSRSGKTEAYVILETRAEVKQPYILMGFQRPPSPGEWRRAIVEQDIDFMLSCFDKVPVRAGDVFIVPGGAPHAIGEGILMIECMEPTDFVARVEFTCAGYTQPEGGRFMGRDVDFAVEMFDFSRISLDDVRRRFFQTPRLLRRYGDDGAEWSLIDERATRRFRVKKLEIAGTVEKDDDSFYVGVVAAGAGRVSCDEVARDVAFGDRFFVPFQTRSVRFEANGRLDVVCALPPLSS
ncbi:MAG: class I mannose-6-phosphate isomerase [Candidatus Sumerlaeota bacterium]|nr:class I mannose-6-phosphate isomerase [Candidatus Sumerlaeota bacterium]